MSLVGRKVPDMGKICAVGQQTIPSALKDSIESKALSKPRTWHISCYLELQTKWRSRGSPGAHPRILMTRLPLVVFLGEFQSLLENT